MSTYIFKLKKIVNIVRSYILEYTVDKIIRLLSFYFVLSVCCYFLSNIIIQDLSWIAGFTSVSIFVSCFTVSCSLPLLSAIIAWLISTLTRNYRRVHRQPRHKVFKYRALLAFLCSFIIAIVILLVFHVEILQQFFPEKHYKLPVVKTPVVVASLLLVAVVLIMVFLFFTILESNNIDHENHILNKLYIRYIRNQTKYIKAQNHCISEKYSIWEDEHVSLALLPLLFDGTVYYIDDKGLNFEKPKKFQNKALPFSEYSNDGNNVFVYYGKKMASCDGWFYLVNGDSKKLRIIDYSGDPINIGISVKKFRCRNYYYYILTGDKSDLSNINIKVGYVKRYYYYNQHKIARKAKYKADQAYNKYQKQWAKIQKMLPFVYNKDIVPFYHRSKNEIGDIWDELNKESLNIDIHSEIKS